MKERPILFSAPMVRAILEGRKTQTRRMVKPQPAHIEWFAHQEGWIGSFGEDAGTRANPHRMVDCPYGKPGDRLWVKETWKADPAFGFPDRTKPTDLPEGTNILYRATLPEDHPKADWNNWKPCLFMRRWMSRITLKMASVRVERLQDISAADALAEGSYLGRCPCLPRSKDKTPIDACFHQTGCHIHGTEYKHLWESINGKGSWAANPFVWVIEFKRV